MDARRASQGLRGRSSPDRRSAVPTVVAEGSAPSWTPVTLLYVGGAILVLAQVIGVYALVTRKADLVFSLVMLGLLTAALVCGGLGAYHQLH